MGVRRYQLRPCYAMSSTGLRYAANRIYSTGLRHAATKVHGRLADGREVLYHLADLSRKGVLSAYAPAIRCPVLTSVASVWRCAMPGTELAYGARGGGGGEWKV
eukprot:3941913-Rhodomonas_salina.5